MAIVYIKELLTAKEEYQVPGNIIKEGTVNHKLITAVFIKLENTWKIRSMQVTQVVPLPPR